MPNSSKNNSTSSSSSSRSSSCCSGKPAVNVALITQRPSAAPPVSRSQATATDSVVVSHSRCNSRHSCDVHVQPTTRAFGGRRSQRAMRSESCLVRSLRRRFCRYNWSGRRQSDSSLLVGVCRVRRLLSPQPHQLYSSLLFYFRFRSVDFRFVPRLLLSVRHYSATPLSHTSDTVRSFCITKRNTQLQFIR